jgi:dynein heavy chain
MFFLCLFPFCYFSWICRFLSAIETAVAFGDVILIENLEETVDPVLDPLLGRNTIKKGK